MLKPILYILFIIVFCSCSNSSNNSADEAKASIGAETYSINGKEIVLRSGPGDQYSKIINQKASDVLHKVEYAEIDNSVKVAIDSVSNGWSKIHVVDPAYLSESHKGWIPSKFLIKGLNIAKDDDSIIKKIKTFNNINLLRQKLSQNGIGELHEWKSDEMGGYMSITDYFRFGRISSTNGMDNNIAYSLLSGNKSSITSLELALNINNKDDADNALNVFKGITKKTFVSVELPTPNGLLGSINNRKSFVYEDANYKASIKLEKSKIDTWVLTIESK